MSGENATRAVGSEVSRDMWSRIRKVFRVLRNSDSVRAIERDCLVSLSAALMGKKEEVNGTNQEESRKVIEIRAGGLTYHALGLSAASVFLGCLICGGRLAGSAEDGGRSSVPMNAAWISEREWPLKGLW